MPVVKSAYLACAQQRLKLLLPAGSPSIDPRLEPFSNSPVNNADANAEDPVADDSMLQRYVTVHNMLCKHLTDAWFWSHRELTKY